jgi:hypothetical protein
MIRLSLTTLLCVAMLLLPAFGAAQQHFFNVTVPMGIGGQTGLGHAVAWGDLDGDGDQDLAFSNQDGSGFWLYRNNGGSGFTDITTSSGLGGIGAYRILWAELTGDEFPELILRRGSTVIYRNEGGITFTNISGGAGVNGTVRDVADFDNDGNADLLTLSSNQLWVEPGDGLGGFADPVLVGSTPDCWTTVCLDYDLDGDQDIYVGTYGSSSPNRLFRNEGGSFSEQAAAAGVAWSGATHGLDAGDYDNDGLPDLYLGAYSSPGCKLYRNNGDGTFTDQAAAAGVLGHQDTRTVSFVDYDNDGWLDIFASHHDFYSYSNEMWHNLGDGSFEETSTPLGLDGEWIGDYFGVGWADYNDDGAPDLFAAGHIDKYRLFRNDSCPGNSLVVELTGSESNPSAIGARASLYFCGRVVTRWVKSGSGRHDCHGLPLIFGLGDCELADSLVITWPSGIVERSGPYTAGQGLEIVENPDLTTVDETPQAGALELRCQPNPCNPRTTLHFELPLPGEARIEIFDVSGRRRGELALGPRPAGAQTVTWHGDDGAGNPLPSGLYLLRLSAAGEIARVKVLILQ